MSTKSLNQKNSVVANSDKLISLRTQLMWTQEEAAIQSGFSDRLIRKIEKGGFVRPQSLRGLLVCYHRSLGIQDWNIADFLAHHDGKKVDVNVGELCSNCLLLKDYFVSVYCRRDRDAIAKYCSPNIRFTGEGSTRQGIEVIQHRANALLTGFNPIEFEFERMHSIDQIVFGFWEVRMKHAGEFLGVPATERWVNLRGSTVAHFVDGKVVESEDQFDVDSIMRQINGEEPRVI